jgi:predicted DNA-binding antitoxin AbrB/MazE fold protein
MVAPNELTVTYTDGVLKPDQRLDLPEGSRITIAMRNQQPTPESRRLAWETIDRIRREGLIRLTGGRLTRDDLYDRR